MTALEILGLGDLADEQQIKERWRELAAQYHPDRGGDAVKFNECRRAYLEALAEAQQPKECGNCRGAGFIKVVSGFYSTRLGCQECGGSGQR